jgi:hypothetical protein
MAIATGMPALSLFAARAKGDQIVRFLRGFSVRFPLGSFGVFLYRLDTKDIEGCDKLIEAAAAREAGHSFSRKTVYFKCARIAVTSRTALELSRTVMRS